MTPHQKIMRANRAGAGLRLSAPEIRCLAYDEDISRRARNDDETCPECGLTGCDRAKRRAANVCCTCVEDLYPPKPGQQQELCEECR
jgi:hypothetical protein